MYLKSLNVVVVFFTANIYRHESYRKQIYFHWYVFIALIRKVRNDIECQTTERSPSRAWQTGGGSFLLLPRRHALSSRWLWALNHNTCENRLEEVQGAETSSLFPPPFFQDTWPCVQHVCAECNAPCQWNLASNKALPPASAAKWQSNDQTDLQC